MALLRLKRKYVIDTFYPNVSKMLFPDFEQIAEQGEHYLIFRVSNELLDAYPADELVDVFVSSNKKDLPVKSFFGHITLIHEGKRLHGAYCFTKSTRCINSVRKVLGIELVPEPVYESF